MTIDKGTAGPGASAIAGSNSTQKETAQEQARSIPSGPRGLERIDQILGMPMSRQATGESVMKYMSRFRQIAEECGLEEKGFKLLTLDGPSVGTQFSAVLVTARHVANGIDLVAVNTMIVESSGPVLQSRTINIGPQQVEVPTVTGDVFDGHFVEKVEDVVRAAFPRATILQADCQVVPRECAPDDDQVTRATLFASVQAAYTVLVSETPNAPAPFSISWIDPAKDNLSLRLDFNPQAVTTPTNLPIRSDVAVTLQTETRGSGALSAEKTRQLTVADCFVDLVFVGPKMMPQAYGAAPVPTPNVYLPRVTLTNFDSATNAKTLELLLLALVSTTMLTTNDAWMHAFRPSIGKKKKAIDIRDIGAIGYEWNPTGDPNAEPARIDTRSDQFTMEKLIQTLRSSCHPHPVYSLLIEETGPSSWITMTFIAAAKRDPAAIEAIFTAADNLTNGAFSRRLGEQRSAGVAHDDDVRMPLGYYVNEEGERRSLQDFDYLSFLNIFGPAQTPDKWRQWEQCLSRKDIPAAMRLETMTNLMREVTGNALKIKGMGRLITMTPSFIGALYHGAQDAGLVITPNNVIPDYNGTAVRGNPTLESMVVQGLNPGMFSYGSRQQFQHPGFGLGGRWGRS